MLEIVIQLPDYLFLTRKECEVDYIGDTESHRPDLESHSAINNFVNLSKSSCPHPTPVLFSFPNQKIETGILNLAKSMWQSQSQHVNGAVKAP